ncbi:MAG: hypothetical protein IRZ07_30020 [Microbispora sp.]|nr:hypothetical protein [Microbispora sp.]
MFRIDDLPAGVTELDGEALEVIAGREPMSPGSGYVCTASQAGDCWMV